MKRSDVLFTVCCVAIVILFGWQWGSRRHAEKAWEKDLHERLLTDFRRSREEIKDYVSQYIPDVTDEMLDEWTASGKLESMVLDGERRYFRNAGPNLFRIDKECFDIKQAAETQIQEVSLSGNTLEGHNADDAVNLPAIIDEVREKLAAGADNPYIAQPERMRVKYTITVDADAVPAGETVRCWLPYPRQDVNRQKNVKFIGASEPKYVFSPEECAHSTLYMEKKAVAGQATVFSEEFEYTDYGEWHPIEPEKVLPYDKSSKEYRKYTSQREKHIVFSPRLNAIADSLTAGIDNPYLQAKELFIWVNDNFPWASAREYSTIENIPEYVLDCGHGDCGQVTLLLLTLCRIKGIPARWQSGFMMHPSGWNLHDWGELYFEGYGWVPVDMSFGIPPYAIRSSELAGIWYDESETKVDRPEIEFFYLGGIDSHRMVVNSDYGMPLYPRKKYPRSETVDFQRGEVEWKGGNLYFPTWDYHMDIEYLPL